MTRYASDTDFEGDADDSWWTTTYWAATVLAEDPELTPHAPSFLTIRNQDERRIRHLIRQFLLAVRRRDHEALLDTLAQTCVDALKEKDLANVAAVVAQSNPTFTQTHQQFFVDSYDVTAKGVTVSVIASFKDTGWYRFIFCVYPEQADEWKITFLPSSEVGSADGLDVLDTKTDIPDRDP